jgi:CheY-like chemotaxis protein
MTSRTYLSRAETSVDMLSRTRRVALVVDDESFARLFAVQVLLDLGFYVLEAADAAEGIEMLRDNEDVAIVFTDISMPGAMDGIGLAHHIRSVRPDVGLLMTSGHAPPADAQAELPARFLAKPYTASILIEAVRDAAGQGNGGQGIGR